MKINRLLAIVIMLLNREKISALELYSKARYRIQDYFDNNDIKFLEDGNVIVNTEVIEDDWVYSMILSYGESVEVLKPQRIRNIIKEKCKKISNIYK